MSEFKVGDIVKVLNKLSRFIGKYGFITEITDCDGDKGYHLDISEGEFFLEKDLRLADREEENMSKFKIKDYVEVVVDNSIGNEYAGQKGYIISLDSSDSMFPYYVKVTPYYGIWFKEKDLKLIKREEVKMEEIKPNISTNEQLHNAILDEMHITYVKKNADYGNSFEKQFEEYGLLSALIRLDDKMRRLKQLSKNEAQVKDESIADTLIDLASYAVMTLMELRKNKHESNNQ